MARKDHFDDDQDVHDLDSDDAALGDDCFGARLHGPRAAVARAGLRGSRDDPRTRRRAAGGGDRRRRRTERVYSRDGSTLLEEKTVGSDGSRVEREYNGAGRLVEEEIVLADGVTIEREYDAAGNIVEEEIEAQGPGEGSANRNPRAELRGDNRSERGAERSAAREDRGQDDDRNEDEGNDEDDRDDGRGDRGRG